MNSKYKRIFSKNIKLEKEIPFFIQECFKFLIKIKNPNEKIFFKNVNPQVINSIKKMVDVGTPINLEVLGQSVVCAVIKHYLLELPLPLFSNDYYNMFEKVIEKPETEQKSSLMIVIQKIPIINLKIFVQILKLITHFTQIDKLTNSTISIISLFGSLIFQKESTETIEFIMFLACQNMKNIENYLKQMIEKSNQKKEIKSQNMNQKQKEILENDKIIATLLLKKEIDLVSNEKKQLSQKYQSKKFEIEEEIQQINKINGIYEEMNENFENQKEDQIVGKNYQILQKNGKIKKKKHLKTFHYWKLNMKRKSREILRLEKRREEIAFEMKDILKKTQKSKFEKSKIQQELSTFEKQLQIEYLKVETEQKLNESRKSQFDLFMKAFQEERERFTNLKLMKNEEMNKLSQDFTKFLEISSNSQELFETIEKIENYKIDLRNYIKIIEKQRNQSKLIEKMLIEKGLISKDDLKSNETN
ncbi:rho gtpase-activating protein 68f [Anaeramoeba ignava]|uniref:Rho gtpase-activating protein 68f n=1 Tax=Anaeramoeba ignava TaxID=1746090 RepID=A0A9Q0R880_ANAIG|nr:rho gtpase-activating protein 68f [Anaeramoeba ignava]